MHALAALWQNPRGRLVVIGVGLIALFIAIRYAAQRGIGATSPIALPATDTTGTTDGTTGGTTTGGTTDGGSPGSTDGGAFSSPYLPYVPGGAAGPGTYIPTGPGVNLTGQTSGPAASTSASSTNYAEAAAGGPFRAAAFAPAAAEGGAGLIGSSIQSAISAGGGFISSALGNIGFNAGVNSVNTPHLSTRVLNPYGPRGAAQATAGGAGPSAGGYSTIGQNQLAHRGVAVAPASSFQAVAPPHPNVSFAGLYRTAGLDV